MAERKTISGSREFPRISCRSQRNVSGVWRVPQKISAYRNLLDVEISQTIFKNILKSSKQNCFKPITNRNDVTYY